jgi:hypothetical protein
MSTSKFAVLASIRSLDSGASPRPVLSLPPSKELDPNLVSDNPTNRLERHHHTNPKESTVMPFLLSHARTLLKNSRACDDGRRISWSSSSTSTGPRASGRTSFKALADSFDQRLMRASAHRAARAMSRPRHFRTGLGRISACSSAARNNSRADRGLATGPGGDSRAISRHSRRALTSCRRLSAWSDIMPPSCRFARLPPTRPPRVGTVTRPLHLSVSPSSPSKGVLSQSSPGPGPGEPIVSGPPARCRRGRLAPWSGS